MSQTSADRNLLIGVIAKHLSFITHEQLLQSMDDWLQDNSIVLDAQLKKQSAIDGETQRLLVELVDKHVSLHGNATQSLLALTKSTGLPSGLERFVEIDDAKTIFATERPEDFATLNFPGSPNSDPLATAAFNLESSATQRSRATLGNSSRFRVIRTHNSGGLGTVSVARDEELGREVALKEIKEAYADHPESRRRFLIEAEITGCLEHPGIVPVYGLGQNADGRPYYAMRFIRGESLQDALERYHSEKKKDQNPRRDQMELRKLLRRVLDMCNAIEYAHSRGVIHRDIKPENVMLGKYGETLVVDWGLAKADDENEVSNQDEPPLRLLSGSGTSSTQMGACMGTPAYMSPEQASGLNHLMKATSDIYSLGATLYTVITGQLAFPQKTLDGVLKNVREGNFQRPRALDLKLSPALEAICMKAMELKPQNRYPSAASFAADIERWMADESISVYTEPLTHRLARWSRHHRSLVSSIAAGTIASVLILSISIVLLWSANNRERTAREHAESNLSVAKQAVATMLTEVGREEIAQFPQMEPIRQTLLGKARTFYDEFLSQKPLDETLRFESAIAMRNLAEIDRLVDDHERAESRYAKAISELKSLINEQPAKTQYRRQLANALNDFGLLMKRRNIVEAENAFDKAIDIQKQLLQSDSNHLLAQELARSFYNRGMVRAEQNNQAAAQADDEAAIQTLVAVLEDNEASDISVKQELSRCYNNLANLLQASGDYAAARTQFANAIELLEKCHEDLPENRDILKELAIFQNNFANMLRAAGDLEQADSICSQAIEKLSQLAEPLPLLANDLANALHSHGVILSQRSMSQEAEAEYTQARTILSRLTEEYPEVSLYHDRLGNTLFQLGAMSFAKKKPAESIPLIENAITEHNAALRLNANEPDFGQHLKNDYVGFTLILLAQGRHADAFRTSVDLGGQFKTDPTSLFESARLSARCIAVVAKDSALSAEEQKTVSSQYTSQAIQSLKDAIKAGFRDRAELDKSLQENGAFYMLRENKDLKETVLALDTPP